MLVQLKELAILDPSSGDIVKSKERKTRQTFKEKPVMVEIESGQKVIESYDYEVSLSGVLNKSETKILTDLALSESTIHVSGYTASGQFLQGSGKIYQDGNSFLIKSNGMNGYGDGGKLLSGMCMSDKLTCMNRNYYLTMPLFFPFNVTLEVGVVAYSTGDIVVSNMDSDMSEIQETTHEISYVPRHTAYVKRSIKVEPVDDSVYISIRSGCRDFNILSTQII